MKFNGIEILVGDRVTGRNGMGGIFTILVDRVSETRAYGRVDLPRNPGWHGYPWAFTRDQVIAIPLTSKHGKGAFA